MCNLLRGLKELKDELYDAVKKDLGYKDQFVANFLQIDASLREVEHDIKHF